MLTYAIDKIDLSLPHSETSILTAPNFIEGVMFDASQRVAILKFNEITPLRGHKRNNRRFLNSDSELIVRPISVENIVLGFELSILMIEKQDQNFKTYFFVNGDF